ncbi:MAG: ATP-binding cassette domain-containing protein [Pirellulaceae bacterium]|nr:ATP-binding cassette domain-containing protein [Pirellulaceae bacterium]
MIRIRDLEFRYSHGGFSLRVPELTVEPCARTAVIGPSGCGKTTLLGLIAGILVPESGSVLVGDTEMTKLADAARRAFRVRRIGLVLQEFELLEHLNVLDNILLPYRISPALKLDRDVRNRAIELAGQVGIGDKLRRCVRRLSQGERQRVAVCRALLIRPDLLLCDEPTGNLDETNKQHVLDILGDYVSRCRATLVAVTHDHEILGRFDRVVDFPKLRVSAEQPP